MLVETAHGKFASQPVAAVVSSDPQPTMSAAVKIAAAPNITIIRFIIFGTPSGLSV
jgi:hypothetical protein